MRLAKLCFCDFEAFTNRLIQTIVSALHCLCTRKRERERERERKREREREIERERDLFMNIIFKK